MFIFIILTFITVINKVIPNQSYEISYKLHSTSNTYYESKSGIRMDDLDFVFIAYLRIEIFFCFIKFLPHQRTSSPIHPHTLENSWHRLPSQNRRREPSPIQSLPIPKGRPITYSVEL